MRVSRSTCAKNMRAVDTNLLVRVLAKDDAKQEKAALTYIAGGVWVSLLVLAEVIWVMRSVYGCERARLCEFADLLLGHNDLHIENLEVAHRALVLFKTHPKLNFADCLILEIARKQGHTPLGTFDSALAKIDGAHKVAT